MKNLAFFVTLLIILALYGCASPATRDQITPDFYSLENKSVSLAVIENRHYVLAGDKNEKFEGIIRGGFGIPITVDRPKRPADERFVDFLADLIKEGFYDVGIEVKVIKADKGSSVEDVIAQIPEPKLNKSIIVVMNESKWDAGGFAFRYQYGFDLYIFDLDGKVIEHKRFTDDQANAPSKNHTVWDMHTIIYREALEQMFKDTSIKNALLKQ